MKKSIYRQFTIAALALIMAFSSLPLAAKPASAAQTGPPMFQDDFEETNAAAWTIGSGTWVTEEGNNEPLFSDDFENGNAAKWTNNGGSWSAVQNGTSTSYGQSGGGASELIAGDSSWTNYVYEADIKLVNGAGAMMDFRYQDSLHFYYLYMSETYIRLMKQNGSVQDWISAYDGPSLQTSATVRIKVEAIGNQFKIYRDGELVLSTADNSDPYLSGKIGLATWATSVEYDNVSVLDTTANHVFVQSDDNGGEAISGELSWSNYSVQTRVALSSLSSDGSAGIRLRQQDSGDGYDMRYLSDSDGGKLQILKMINGEKTIVAEAPFSMQTGRSYVWKGVAAGKYLDLYIDGNKYLSVVDSTYTTGKIALMLLNATASYDNVIVEQVSVPIISDGNTTFYVSSSMGDDNNDGLSEATAWRTLEKANEAEFHAGDNLLLKSGDRWNEPLILQGSGTAEFPIRVSSYGTGDKPVIAWNAPHGGSVLSGRNLSNWVIQGLALQIIPSSTQSWSKITAGIQLYYDNSNGHGNVLIDGNDVYSSTYDSNTNGIVISASVPGTDNKEVARDLTISNNTVHDIGWYAITTTGWDTEKNEELRSQLMYGNVKVSGNEVYNTASQGIVVQNAHNSVIERNVVHDGGLGTDTWGPGGLWFIASRDSVIKFNEIYNMKDANSGFDGAGLNIDWYCDNITVQYNYSHDNKGNGITTMSNYGTKIINNKVKGNKAQQSNGNGQIALGNFTGRPDLSSGLHNVEVASNTILVDVDGTSAINSASNPYGTWTGITIHDNNVVIGQGMPDNEVFSIAPNTSINAIDGNRIYSDSSAFRSILHGTEYTGLALWQAGTGYDLNSKVLPQDQTAPSSVSNVAAASDGYVQLTWELAEDQSSGIAHYNIYRSVTPQFELTYANMVGESASASFEDREDVQANTTYYYRVEAEDRNGNVGVASDTVGITTGATVPTPEQLKFVDFMAPRDQDIISLASLIAKPYLSGIPNVRSVQLFVDDRLAQESDSFPYSFLLEGLKNGKHRLQYKVHDTNGGVIESAPITIDKQVVALRSLYATTAPIIDSDLSDWETADFRMDQRSQVKNIDSAFSDNWTPQKLKAAGNTRWDDTNLYVAVSVTEDEHHLSITNAADLWKGSSIQIAIDPDRGSAPGSKGYTEFAFGLTDDGSALAYRYHAIDGKVAGAYSSGQLSIVRNESTKLTDYEIAIPWSEIIPSDAPIGDGSSLGISVLANYSDGTHVNPASGDARNGWIEYNSGIGAGKAPGLFGYLLLGRQLLTAPAIGGTAMPGGKVSLIWSEVAGATGYTLKYGTASGTYTNTLELGNSTAFEIEGLSIGTTYSFAIEAYDAYGVSELSNELRLTLLADDITLPSGNPGITNHSDSTVAVIPVSTIGDTPFILDIGQATITLSPSLLKTWMGQADQLEGATIEVRAVPVTDSTKASIPASDGRAMLRAASQTIDIRVSLLNSEGKQAAVKPYNGGLTLSLPYDTDAKEELLGIYGYDGAAKRWEYIGGDIDPSQHRITVDMPYLGLYSVVEYKLTFDDVSSGHWVARALHALAAKHIVKGMTDARFNPSSATTRAEFVALLVRALHLQAIHADAAFTDVRPDAWYADAIAAAVEAGIVVGKADNRFAPQEPITRMEMAAMIVRAIGLPTTNGEAKYADVNDIPQWAIPFVVAVSEAKLMQGKGDNRFAPGHEATRAEAAQLLYNLLNDHRK